jgi:hypothetical protein
MLLFLTQMVFFQEINVFFQLSWIGLLGTKCAFLHLEHFELHEVFLPKIHSVLIGKQCTRCSCFRHRVFFFRVINVFIQLSWLSLFGQKKLNSTLKILISRKYSFQKLTQFSQEKNVLNSGASNVHCFLWRDTWVSQTYLKGPLWSKQKLSPHWNT